MKKVYLIGGAMGVGKTTVCRLLKHQLPNSVFLDGDWCWDMHPIQITDETKAMVMDNICYLLNNYIRCSAFENVIFAWVMHEQSIIDTIISRVDMSGCEVKTVSLVCNRNALIQRLRADVDAGIRQADVIERSMRRLPLYAGLQTVKIDVSDMTPAQAAEQIRN
jgi:broad-specificity NMP kinase